MSRIGDYAATSNIVRYMQDIQLRTREAQLQVTTEKKSQLYSGYAMNVQRLLHVENTASMAERYVRNNEIMQLRLDIFHNAMGGIEKSVRDFKDQLDTFIQGDMGEEGAVRDIQKWAITALKNIENYLNTQVDGVYIFAGSRTNTEPVNLGITDLANFQVKWDGDAIQYPTRAANHTSPKLTAATGSPTDPTGAGFGTLTFDAAGTITAANAGSFANVPVGSTITISGSAGNNDTFTVTANDGTEITVAEVVANEAATAAPTMTSDVSYYQGDQKGLTHRVDQNRTIDLNINATHPAFEKVIRALSIVAQGAFGTAGGLDQNQDRAEEAHWLLASALDEPVGGTPPYGAADVNSGNITGVGFAMGFNQILLKDTNERFNNLIGYMKAENAKIENVDMTEAVARLMDESRALEASYHAFSQIQSLSLVNFL